MGQVLQAAAGVLLAVILCLILGKQTKEMSVLLSAAVCCMVAVLCLGYLRPVTDFFSELEHIGNLDGELLSILLKAVGIAFIAEISGLICADAGNAALGKVLQMLACAVILYLSIPLLRSLMALVTELLGEV